MCFGKIKHFYYFELDILCFLELKADNNNLWTVAFSNHTNRQISSCNLLGFNKIIVIDSQQ